MLGNDIVKPIDVPLSLKIFVLGRRKCGLGQDGDFDVQVQGSKSCLPLERTRTPFNHKPSKHDMHFDLTRVMICFPYYCTLSFKL